MKKQNAGKKAGPEDLVQAGKRFKKAILEGVCQTTIRESFGGPVPGSSGLEIALSKACEQCFSEGLTKALTKEDLFWLETARAQSKIDVDVSAAKAAQEKYQVLFSSCSARMLKQIESSDPSGSTLPSSPQTSSAASTEEKTKNAALRSTSVVSPADQYKLARDLQHQLKRVGCEADEDGTWGAKSKFALADFSRLTKVVLAIDEPTFAALDAVTKKKSRVCSIQCRNDHVESHGKCVEARRKSNETEAKAEGRASRPSERVRQTESKALSGSSADGYCASNVMPQGGMWDKNSRACNP